MTLVGPLTEVEDKRKINAHFVEAVTGQEYSTLKKTSRLHSTKLLPCSSSLVFSDHNQVTCHLLEVIEAHCVANMGFKNVCAL